ncbi:Cysteine-rich receptor-like protein kinase [Actinidia chinensis var. chinensis]|uniref:Cysteine-rich receptor-like protein kinase n=1 Tax=Actinidia chinensis var. chinensis TaxID=1590841 RepID=A0A2R6RAY1_ACTCC|nr:Cysteine-rich receptor-like protein kinase [Actinidia chinensis var. chinensis]
MQISNYFFLFKLSLLSIISETKAAGGLRYVNCKTNHVTYTPDSTYADNLAAVFAALSSKATAPAGFHNSTAGRGQPDAAYGLFLCRGDISPAACQYCVTFASTQVVQRCSTLTRATIWYDDCMLRYSDQSIFAVPDLTGGVFMWNTQNVTDVSRFEDVLGGLMRDIVNRASIGGLGKKFATGEANFSSLQSIYALAQCTPDITTPECYSCLVQANSNFPSCCAEARGAQVLFPSCNVRYETYPFYKATAFAAPPPPVVILAWQGSSEWIRRKEILIESLERLVTCLRSM